MTHITAPATNTVAVISMGCSKNLVDSEHLIHLFGQAGYTVEHNPDTLHADQVVINTCGFIGDAKQESIDMILECIDAKNHGKVRQVNVMGCLSQRYRRELQAEIPEVDRWYGKFDWAGLVADITGTDNSKLLYGRTLTTPSHHAYIKIAEGCNRFCAFCAIPLITGRLKSRSVDEVVSEVKQLVSEGVKEFNIIAQDLSGYGTDIDGKSHLAELLQALADVSGVEWIRLHYAYPADFPYDILPVMRNNANICKYLDIALQHISDTVLKNMRRHIDADSTRMLLKRLRDEVPGIAIRTTLMVGFPGEGEKEYAELLDFVREQRFDRMGAFAYCEEDDTYAAKNYTDVISDDEKQRRLDGLMRVQEAIDLELAEEKIGKTMRVICDGDDAEFWICRSEFDSPDVDPNVLVAKRGGTRMQKGQFYNVTVTEAYPHDLVAKINE